MLPILHQSLWRDEAFSLLLSEKNPLEIIRFTTKDVSPPLSYILLHYWMVLFGNNEVTARTLSFLFHVATVIVVFFIAKKLIKSPFLSLLIAFTTLLNPFLAQYAFEARPYSMLCFFTVFSVLLLMHRHYFLSGLISGAAILTQNFGVFNFAALLTFLFLFERPFPFKKILSFVVIPLIALLSWGSIIWNQWTKIREGFWIQSATITTFYHSLQRFSTGDVSYKTSELLFIFTLIILCFAFAGWVFYKKEERKNDVGLIAFVAFFPPLIAFLISFLFTPIYHERYLISTVPFSILLIAILLRRFYVKESQFRNAIIALIAIYTIVLLQSTESVVLTSTKPPINYAVSQILQKTKNGDVIVTQSPLNFLETRYYVKRSSAQFPVFTYSPTGKIPFYIGSILFEKKYVLTKLPKNKRIWLVKPNGGHELVYYQEPKK